VTGPAQLERLWGCALVTSDAEALACFYERAFGARRLQGDAAAQTIALPDMPSATARIALMLGSEPISLQQFDRDAQSQTCVAAANDLAFQHFAIVVSDLDAAYRRLMQVDGWTAISTGGPQRLPASSGGVTAFKFRDPEGHPLELLAFDPDHIPAVWRERDAGHIVQGIDHSAISVSDSAQSIAFYGAMGFRVVGRSLNQGAAQARLDGLDDPCVEVTALALPQATPHLELLCYRSFVRETAPIGAYDLAATRLLLEAARTSSPEREAAVCAIADPDGHRLLVTPWRRRDVSEDLCDRNAHAGTARSQDVAPVRDSHTATSPHLEPKA